jgi:hypothetical protein
MYHILSTTTLSSPQFRTLPSNHICQLNITQDHLPLTGHPQVHRNLPNVNREVRTNWEQVLALPVSPRVDKFVPIWTLKSFASFQSKTFT